MVSFGDKWHECEKLKTEIERQQELIGLASHTIIECEKACWKEGQTIEGLNKDIRRTVGKFIAEAQKQGVDYLSAAVAASSVERDK